MRTLAIPAWHHRQRLASGGFTAGEEMVTRW
jgi:hypothetical protein